MGKFKRNWNEYGMDEPLLFPIKRAGQPEIHLARLLKEYFEFDGGSCVFYQFKGSVRNSGHLAPGPAENCPQPDRADSKKRDDLTLTLVGGRLVALSHSSWLLDFF